MKKIIFALVLILTTVSANAQLNITGMKKDGPKKVYTLQAGYSYLYNTSDGYAIYLNTDNRFDESYSVILLGEDKDSCIQSLNDLMNIIENKISSTLIEQADPWGDLIIMYGSQLGVPQLTIKNKGNAGKSFIIKSNIKKAIKYFNEL